MSTHGSDVDYPYRQNSGAREPSLDESSPSYSDIHTIAHGESHSGEEPPPPTIQELPYTVYRAMSTQNVVIISPRSSGSPQQQQEDALPQGHQQQERSLPSSQAQTPFPHTPTIYISPSGLHATLELESDTVEIYDRSHDGFQYSLKGSVDLEWIGGVELLLKDAQVDFMGYADTAILRYESGAGPAATETPVHHTHDFIPTPLVLAQSSPTEQPPLSTTGSSSINNNANPPSKTHQKSLAIDLTIPGHLPDTTNLAIGKIRYELQVSLEVTWAPGTTMTTTEKFILRRPVLVHRIVYPSAHLQPRLTTGLDSGGVEIQVKVPRLLHCENTLLAVELYAKPRTRNVRLYKAKVVFEQIETDRYQRTSAGAAVPRAIVPLATSANASGTSPSLNPLSFPTTLPQQQGQGQSAGPPPVPRLLTHKIAQPLEVLFEEPTAELQSQNLHLQLVLSPDLCVDVQSSWLQISHTLRVEIEYTTDDEAYITAPPVTAPPPPLLEPSVMEDNEGAQVAKVIEGTSEIDLQEDYTRAEPGGLWDQEGDAIEDDDEDDVSDGPPITNSGSDEADDKGVNVSEGRPQYILDEKRAVRAVLDHDIGSGSSTVPDHHHHLLQIEDIDRPPSPPPPILIAPQSPTSTAAVIAGESIHPESSVLPNANGGSGTHRHAASNLATNLVRPSTGRSSGSAVSSSSATYSLATEEIPVRVVRVVATALVDASTIAQAAGETEAGLPTYESVMEATGLPAYAEEKLEDDHEDAEASGTVSGVLGGAARRLEGDDAEVERRSS
ncbi:hypothetical protein EC991_006155 [Linnemannia zychae]|nr:hypothetical protein EC991_006155 [Linnemannia zychae]